MMKRLIAVKSNGIDLLETMLLSKDSKQADIELEAYNLIEERINSGEHWYIDQIDDPTGHHETGL